MPCIFILVVIDWIDIYIHTYTYIYIYIHTQYISDKQRSTGLCCLYDKTKGVYYVQIIKEDDEA
jgi:hypothetical protein